MNPHILPMYPWQVTGESLEVAKTYGFPLSISHFLQLLSVVCLLLTMMIGEFPL